MALNRFMHEENVFKSPPNFKELAVKYPQFRKHVRQDISGKVMLDFKNPNSLRVLSTVLLQDTFNLSVDIPATSLIPTIPSRLNYLLWVKDLLKLIPDMSESVHGIDIGTGASAVYSLLAARHLGWNMLGTEVEAENLKVSKLNIENNKLQDKIQVVKVTDQQILSAETWNRQSFHFSMCNPPFFCSSTDSKDKGPDPGKSCEVKTQGGEVKFIQLMADQSRLIKDKVKIFTSLCGHKSSLVPVKQYLTSLQVHSLATTEFCQGKTMRWGVAWTWSQIDLNSVKSLKYKKSKEKAFTWSIPGKNLTSINFFQSVKSWLSPIQVEVAVKKETKNFCCGRISSYECLWRNQRKKRRQKDQTADVTPAKLSKVENLGKLSEQSIESSNDDSESTESCLIQQLLNDDGKRLVNSFNSNKEDSKLEAPSESTERSESSATSDTKDNNKKDYELEANLTVRLSGPMILVELSYLGGQAGRDGAHQILQFIKNKHQATTK